MTSLWFKVYIYFLLVQLISHAGNKMDGNEGGRAPTKFRPHPTKFLHFAQLSVHFYSTTNNQSTLHVRL